MIKKKILIVCDSSKTLLDFRGKLIERMIQNNQVYVFTPEITQDFVRKRLQHLGVKVIESKLKGSYVSIFSDINFMLSLFRLIREIDPDVFFPYTLKPVIYGTLIAKLCRVKLMTPMLTGLGYSFTDGNTSNKMVVAITKFLLKYSLKANSRLNIIFQNKDDAQQLVDLKILSSKHNIFVVNGSGVDLSHYAYTKPKTDSVTFLMIARLINAKGINEYLEAAKIIHAKYPSTKFNLIGDYDKNIDCIPNELYDKIISGVPIQYLGRVDDVRPAITDASVVVLPSYYREGVPRSILESLAMGRAVITCDSPGCRETVNRQLNRENGFLVPAKDSIALASRMEYFILNRDKIIPFGEEGLAYAREKFDVNLVNRDMLKIMQLEN